MFLQRDNEVPAHTLPPSGAEKLGDFTATPRMLAISLLAIVIGVIAAYVAWFLLRLIGVVTNLSFFLRWGTALVSPAANHLGYWEVLVPVVGSLIVGLMARYGSERIRGHGIPEAIESILINGSKVPPRLAILKPIASAIAIGTGGPFGAEGPIIMTGGAFGSMIAQLFHLSSAERKTLLVAGASAGMAATFAAPVSAVLLGVELLLFEWKPRSLVPVALASVTAGAARRYILGLGPLFPVPQHPAFIGPVGLLACVAVGLLAGILALVVTEMVYTCEDWFGRLPIHWMWWPMIGGLVVGVGGLIFPQALGVGYDTIGQLLQGSVARNLFLGILLVKSVIWAVSLSSGTSGGTLAPLLMMGGALGGLEASFLPHLGAGFWPLVSMGATLGAALNLPLTAVVFAIELTHDINMFVPLLLATTMSYTLVILTMKRSILTEKVARRGFHLSREYSVDPLEVLFVREVMRSNVVALPGESTPLTLSRSDRAENDHRGQYLYPVVGEDNRLLGVITRKNLNQILQNDTAREHRFAELAKKDAIVAYAEEPLRVVVNRMADTALTRMPVVEKYDKQKLVGMVSLSDLLRARTRAMEEERKRERVLRIRLPFGGRRTAVRD